MKAQRLARQHRLVDGGDLMGSGSNRCARRMRCASDTSRNSEPSPSKLYSCPLATISRRPSSWRYSSSLATGHRRDFAYPINIAERYCQSL